MDLSVDVISIGNLPATSTDSTSCTTTAITAVHRIARNESNCVFPIFNLIQLIRWQKKLQIYEDFSEAWTHKSSARHHNHYITESTVCWRHSKAFSNIQLCLTDSSWIHLILLIQKRNAPDKVLTLSSIHDHITFPLLKNNFTLHWRLDI